MTEPPRRPFRRATPSREVGAPNVLSNEARPNTLSGMARAGRGWSSDSSRAPGAAPEPALAIPSKPTTVATRSTVATGLPAIPAPRTTTARDDRFDPPRRRRRSPSLGAIIFFGIILFNAARFFGNSLGPGSATPIPTPQPVPTSRATTQPLATINSAPGKVVFGESPKQDGCKLEHTAIRFTLAIDVWWRAEMTHTVDGDATVVYVASRDDAEVDREMVPPDPDVGTWAILCGGGPVPGYQPGTYRVEIWNEDETELLSSGTYTKFATGAPGSAVLPTRRPSPTP